MNILSLVVIVLTLVVGWGLIIRFGNGWSMVVALLATILLALAAAESSGLIRAPEWLRPAVRLPRPLEAVVPETPQPLAPPVASVPAARQEHQDLLKKFREGTP